MTVDPVRELVISLRKKLGNIPVVTDVPASRPKKFVSVELTGLSIPEPGLLYPVFAVQTWGSTHAASASLGHQTRQALLEIGREDGNLFTHVSLNSMYNWPDPDSRQARYQLVVETICYDQNQ